MAPPALSYGNDGEPVTIPESQPRLPVDGADRAASQTRAPLGVSRLRVSLEAWRSWTDARDREADKQHIEASVKARGGLAALNRLVKFSEYCNRVEQVESLTRWQELYGYLRDWIKTIKGRDVSQDIVNQSQILARMETFLAPDNSQAERFLSSWMKEELKILHPKWTRGDYLCDPNRGLIPTHIRNSYGAITRTRYALDKNWEHYVDSKEFGHNGLTNGQIWSSRLQLLRDGAHGAKIAGISGTVRDGAYSITMDTHSKENNYADIDMREMIEYEGTPLSEAKASSADNDDSVTVGTAALITSLRTQNPVRVFRAFKTSMKGVEKVYRYDGLYKVIRRTLKDEKRQHWSFRLERQSGQGPVRGGPTGHSAPVARRSG